MIDIQDRAKSIFLNVMEIASERERTAYLQAQCGQDDELRREVGALLDHAHRLGGFLESNAAGIQATIDQPSERIGSLIGRYKLLEQIGEGGMGIVFVAEQTEPVRRRVALKIIKPGMDTKQVIARFEAERQALAMMDHPNIAKILDAGTVGQASSLPEHGPAGSPPHDGRPYFVMELVRGMPITEYCDKARLAPRQRLELFVDVCQAVQHAHQKGIIHRDLKPSNVMVTMQDGRPVVKVIDFGVAKAICGAGLWPANSGHTVYTGFAQLVGTPLYMSPEQAELTSHDVDTRSDVYSLGVLLYELLTGQTPFDKETLSKAGFDEMRRMIREDEPLRPSHRVSTLNAQASSTISQRRSLDERHLSRVLRGELDWIVMKALEKDRSRRYESASALATDIQRYLSDEPVLACPPTTMYRFQKFARKHKPALATAAAIAACLILGTTVSAWQAARATTAEAQANANEQKANANAAQAQTKAQEATDQRDEAERQRDEVKSLNDRLRRTLYASNMNLAQNAWDAGTITRVRELLNQHRPKANETDLRGFEWHYLNRLCRSELLTVRVGTAGWENIVFSPDGKHFASTGSPSTVKIWDAQTGKEVLVIKDLKVTVLSVAYSPDGKRIAGCAGWDYTAKSYVSGGVKIWDTETGQELLSIQGHQTSDIDVAFSPDGKRIAAGGGKWGQPGEPGELTIWDSQTGEKLLDLTSAAGQIRHIAFSPDGKRLASAHSNNVKPAIKVWDAHTGAEQFSLELPIGGASSVAFSPDGKRLASSGQIWDVESGKELLSFEKDSRTASSSIIEFSPDGKRVACSNSAVIEIRDAQTAELVLTLKGHTGPMHYAAFSPDGKKLVTRSGDRSIKVWDATAEQEARIVSDDTRAANRVSFSPDGKRVAYVEGDNFERVATIPGGAEFKICELPTGRELFRIKTPTSRLTFSPDGNRLIGTSRLGATVFDGESGKELFALPGPFWTAIFSPDGKRLANQTSVGAVKVLDSQSGQELVAFKAHSKQINHLAYSPDGKRLATHSSDGWAKIFDDQTGKELLKIKVRLPEWQYGTVAFSPDGKRLAVGCLASDYSASSGGIGEVQVWDSETGRELLALKGHTALIQSIAFSPDGKRLASGAAPSSGRQRQGGEVKVWDAETGHDLLTLKAGGNGRITFGPDGNWLACDTGGVIKIYDATPLPEKP